MLGGDVVDFLQISGDARLQTLLEPNPGKTNESEYNNLKTICSEILGDIDEKTIVKIQSNHHPIYRSSHQVFDEDRDSKGVNKPEIMTRFLLNSADVDLSKNLGGSIFILINRSCFKPTWSLTVCRELMQLWKKKIQDGLNDFVGGIGGHDTSPSIEVVVYEDVSDIEQNPMKYYAETLKNRHASKVLKKQLPTIFIDCSPFANHLQYQFDYKGELPEFTLCFSLLQGEGVKIPKNELDQIATNVGSGFTIFQKVEPNDSMKSVAEVLKIAAVLSGKMVIGSKHKDTRFFEHLSRGAFFESRKAKNSKSSSTKLNKKYKSYSHFMPSGIRDFSANWIDCNGDQVHNALKEYYRSLMHCKYESDDIPIRIMSELRIKDWSKLTYNIATHFDEEGGLKFSGEEERKSWYRLVREENNKKFIIGHLQLLKKRLNNPNTEDELEDARTDLSKIQLYLKRIVEVNENLNINDFIEFYDKFSTVIFKLKEVYEISHKFAHSNAMENTNISKLNDYKIYFYLSARLRLYKPLENFLQGYREMLIETKKLNPKIANALKEAMRLDFRSEEVPA